MIDTRTEIEKIEGAREFMLQMIELAKETPEQLYIRLSKLMEREASGLNRLDHLEEFERYCEALDMIILGEKE